MNFIVHVCMKRIGRPYEQILSEDDNDNAGRPYIFLRAGVDQAVLVDVDFLIEEIGRSVAYERYRACFRFGFIFRSEDRIIRSKMNIGSIRVKFQFRLKRQPGIIFGFCSSRNVDRSDPFTFFNCFFRPGTRHDIIGFIFRRHKIQWYH